MLFNVVNNDKIYTQLNENLNSCCIFKLNIILYYYSSVFITMIHSSTLVIQLIIYYLLKVQKCQLKFVNIVDL